jgi:hypothetical protein
MLFTDPPEHTRLRRLLSPAFTPNPISRLRPRVAAITDAVLDGLDDAGPGAEVDVVADIAYPVALAVIAELFDVGAEGAQVFAEHTPTMVRMLEIEADIEDLTASAIASTEVMLFLTPLFAERRHTPGEDFISALRVLCDQPDGLDLQDALATCILVLVAGHETTANLIANSTLALLKHPDQIPHLHTDPHRAIEELLRLEGAAKLIGRTALIDHQVAGQHIDAGSAVLIDIRQANRDPHRWAEPQRLELSRSPAGNLAFGGGAHFCLGAALARLEATESLTRFFSRQSELRLTDAPIRWREWSAFHGLDELRLTMA